MKRLQNAYKSTLNQSIMGTDPTTVVGQYVEIARYIVVAGQGIALGYGNLAGQSDAIGRIYMKIIDDTAGDVTLEPGMIRIEARNPQDRPIATLFEARTEDLNCNALASPTPADKVSFPMMKDVLTEDFAIVVLLKADAADILDTTDCVMSIDITNFDVLG